MELAVSFRDFDWSDVKTRTHDEASIAGDISILKLISGKLGYPTVRNIRYVAI